jgi:deoxyribonuclease V
LQLVPLHRKATTLRRKFSIITSESMNIHWPKNITAARQIQERDRAFVRIEPLEQEPLFVAGIDASFSGDRVFGAACVYRFPELTLVEDAGAVAPVRFPYVPGFLLFREGPALIAAIRKLKTRPDLLLVDGQGIAHPSGIGSASHLGVLLGIPAIGCAKTRLVGKYREPGMQRQDWSDLNHEGRNVGAVVRTRMGVRPLFVSPGHRVDLAAAIRIVMQCTGKYRIPEPLRCADKVSRRMKKSEERTG